MIMSRQPLRIAALFFCILLSAAANAAPQLAISPFGYQIIQVQGVPGNARAFDVTARAGVFNPGDPATAVTARLMSSSPNFIVLDGDLTFGSVPRTPIFRPVISLDTFKLRVILPPNRNRNSIIEFIQAIHRSLAWQVSCGNCGVNRPPVANAGADQTVYATQTVTLDGSASTDPDGQALTYAWSFLSRPAGSAASLTGATNVKPTFVPDRDGNYVVQLIVNDGQLSSAADTVQISTLNSAPVANAGADQSALTGQAVALDGSASSDIDGDVLTYAWSVVTAPSGSLALIVNPSQVKPSFTPDLAGQYVIELIVDDGTVSSAPDTMVITTTRQNSPPDAHAGPGQTVHVGDTAHLDGTSSFDPDGDALTYHWSLNARPANSNTGLQGDTSPSPTLPIDKPGTYVAQLIVSDGTADSSPDTVSLSTTNTAPVASVSAPSSVHWNSTVQVDGSASTDVDGDALGFTWSLLSFPAGSHAVISDPNAIKPTFQADRPGVYVVQLVVNDGRANGAPASASVTATNQAPVARDDSATTSTNAFVDVPVLGNDSDPDADTLSIGSVSTPAHGTAIANGTSIAYTPAPGFSGNDSFTYTATDGADSASASVSITVTANNTAPTAVLAIAPNSANVGTGVTLSFAGSSDPDAGDHVASYSIVLRSAPAGSLGGGAGGHQFAVNVPQSTTGSALTFVPDAAGSFGFELTAIDTHNAMSAPASATLTATQAQSVNHAPIANAGADATANVGDLVPLGGAGSSDPDGDTLSYTWSILSGPANGASLSATNVASPTLSATVAGTYVVRLVVSDGQLSSAPDDVSITFNAVAPVDSDGDGLSDADELVYGTDPHNPDTDGDGFLDGGEVQAGSDPKDAASVPLPSTGPTSDSLIADALGAGTLTAEQALVYRMYAEFRDPRLPAQFRGAPLTTPDNPVVAEAARLLPSLSPATQDILRPFFIPPYYEGSWLDLRLHPAAVNTVAAKSALRASAATHAPAVTLDAGGCVHPPSGNFDSMSTPHALIHFPGAGDPSEHGRGEQFAQLVVKQYIEQIWATETALFNRTPNDASVTSGCNGGDERLDITVLTPNDWLAAYGAADAAWGRTVPYEEGCSATPSHILIRAPQGLDAGQIERMRDVLAHEVFHTIELMFTHTTACSDFTWLGEATANWAIDLVFPTDTYEHTWARQHTYGEHLVPIDEGQIGAAGQANGYNDYVFMLYVARHFNYGVIKSIWDATQGSDSIHALNAGLNGALKDVWHDFALAMWNDYPNGLHHELHDTDDALDWGMKKALEKPVPDPDAGGDTQKVLEAKLDGARSKDFELMETVGAFNTAAGIERLSFHYDYIKFTDNNVHFVSFEAPVIAPDPNFKMHAFLLINGQWTEDDWTNMISDPDNFSKTWCRDQHDEHLEELVLIYSNGNPERPSPAILVSKPKLSVSNGGCLRWSGTSAVTVTTMFGYQVKASAAVTFDYDKDLTGNSPSVRLFRPSQGTASIEAHGFLDEAGVCSQTYVLNTALIAPTDGYLSIGLVTGDSNPLTAGGQGLTLVPNTTVIVECSGNAVTTSATIGSTWLSFDATAPFTGSELSADGQTLQGSKTYIEPTSGLKTVVEWNLHAEQQ